MVEGGVKFADGVFFVFVLYIPRYKSTMINISFPFVRFKEE